MAAPSSSGRPMRSTGLAATVDPRPPSRCGGWASKGGSTVDSIPAYAQLNARIMPINRGEQYEDPLQDALAQNGLGQVTGGGTMQSENGEIAYCGIDVDLFDL